MKNDNYVRVEEGFIPIFCFTIKTEEEFKLLDKLILTTSEGRNLCFVSESKAFILVLKIPVLDAQTVQVYNNNVLTQSMLKGLDENFNVWFSQSKDKDRRIKDIALLKPSFTLSVSQDGVFEVNKVKVRELPNDNLSEEIYGKSK